MTGKKLVNNIRWFLDESGNFDLPITVFDTTLDQDAPFISVGYTSDELHDSYCPGHYTNNIVIVVAMNGHDYTESQVDAIEDTIIETLSLSLFPLSANYAGDRPSTKCHINDYFLMGTERQQEGSDTTLALIQYEFHTAAKDFTL